MPPKRRGMRRFFCCGPKDEAESNIPSKPAKQVSEKVDRSGVTSSGKARKENQSVERRASKTSGEASEKKLSTEQPGLPTSEGEATKDDLTAEKPTAPTTESEGIEGQKQSAEEPSPTSEETGKEQPPVDTPAVPTTADAGEEQLIVESPAVQPTDEATEEKLHAEVPAAAVENETEADDLPVEQPAVSESAETVKEDSVVEHHAPSPKDLEESSATPAVEDPTTEVPASSTEDDSTVETPVESAIEKTEEESLPVEPPVIPAKAESRNKEIPTPTDEGSPAETPTPSTEVQSPTEVTETPLEEPVASAKEDVPAEESFVSAKEDVLEEESTAQTGATEETSPAETSVEPTTETLAVEEAAVSIQERRTSVDSTRESVSDEGHDASEDSIVESREVVPVDPPVLLTKDEDTYSEGPSIATESEDDETPDSPHPGITREDSVIPKGQDEKLSKLIVPRLFPNNRQGDILQRAVEEYLINGKPDWKIIRKYLPKGDDSAAKLTKVILTRMMENCLSEVELTEGRVFLPILREQLALLYWEDNQDKKAIKLWRKVLCDSNNDDSDSIVYRAKTNSTRQLCNIYFTKALEAHMSGENPSRFAKQLEEAAGRGADPITTMWWYAHCSSLMLTAWHQISDEDTDMALENFRFNAKCAVGKLNGRNPSNAKSGFLLLAETLMTAADNWESHVESDQNATRAMSLFLQHQYGVELKKNTDDSSSPAPTYGACETCDTELSWGHFQTCRYCKVDFCDSCHKCLEETTLPVRICSPVHDFFRTSGPAPHEMPKDHVLLDGEQVHYKRWIAELKEEWGL